MWALSHQHGCFQGSACSCFSSSWSLGWGGELGDAMVDGFLRWVLPTTCLYLLLAVSRPPSRAWERNKRDPDSAHGVGLFWCCCWCLAESKGQALILQMVFIKLNKKKKERTRNYNYSLFNTAVWKGLDSAHKSGVRLCRFVNVLGTFCIFQDACVEKNKVM